MNTEDMRNELASAQAILGNEESLEINASSDLSDPESDVTNMEGVFTKGFVVDNLSKIFKSQHIDPIISGSLMSLLGASGLAASGFLAALEAPATALLLSSLSLPTGVLGISSIYQGVLNKVYGQHAAPILEEMEEDSSRKIRPTRWSQGGDVPTQDFHKSTSAEDVSPSLSFAMPSWIDDYLDFADDERLRRESERLDKKNTLDELSFGMAKGGDVPDINKEYQSLNAELERLQKQYDEADVEKRKEIWSKIESKHGRAGELKRQIDAANYAKLNLPQDDFDPPVEWNPDDEEPPEPPSGPGTMPKYPPPRPSPAQVDYSMAFAHGGDVPDPEMEELFEESDKKDEELGFVADPTAHVKPEPRKLPDSDIDFGQHFAQGGEVPVMLEPGEKVSPPNQKPWFVPNMPGKPDSGDVFPSMLEPGTHVTPKEEVRSEFSFGGDVQHMAAGGIVRDMNIDVEEFQRDEIDELAEAVKRLTDIVKKMTDAMEKQAAPQETPDPMQAHKVRSTTFDPQKAKERFGKPPGGRGQKSAEELAAYAQSVRLRNS